MPLLIKRLDVHILLEAMGICSTLNTLSAEIYSIISCMFSPGLAFDLSFPTTVYTVFMIFIAQVYNIHIDGKFECARRYSEFAALNNEVSILPFSLSLVCLEQDLTSLKYVLMIRLRVIPKALMF